MLKGRSDRGGRTRRLEEDLASKEGVNKAPARRGDKPYREEITTETTDHLEFHCSGRFNCKWDLYQEREGCDLSRCTDSATVREEENGQF